MRRIKKTFTVTNLILFGTFVTVQIFKASISNRPIFFIECLIGIVLQAIVFVLHVTNIASILDPLHSGKLRVNQKNR